MIEVIEVTPHEGVRPVVKRIKRKYTQRGNP
jgi:hypothetical protein